MRQFILDYIGKREVTHMMILDNVMAFRFGSVLRHDYRRPAVEREMDSILAEYIECELIGKNGLNFFYRKDLRCVTNAENTQNK